MIHRVAADSLQPLIDALKHRRINLQLASTSSADEVIVIALRQLVCQVPVRLVGLPDDAVIGQKFECAVDGRLGYARDGAARSRKDLHGGQVAAGVSKDVQDRHALGRHAEAQASKPGGVCRRASHDCCYCKFLQ